MARKQINIILLLGVILFSCAKPEPAVAQELREQVELDRGVYKVVYSEVKEQPIKLIYKSLNRPKLVSRGSMNFWKPKDVHTSDDADYYDNDWDKGHLLPAATVSHHIDSLKQSFSYENSSLQHMDLNRGLWKYLESMEREWDDAEDLVITIESTFSTEKVKGGATIPKNYIKHIYFTKSKYYRCWEFENISYPRKKELLPEFEVVHNHD